MKMVSNPLPIAQRATHANVTCDLDKTGPGLYLKHRVCLTHQRNLPC